MTFDMDVQCLCQMSLLTSKRSRSRSKLKVKAQGQNCCTEYLPLAIAQVCFKLSLPNWQSDRSTLGMKYAFQQNSRGRPGGGLHSVECFFRYDVLSYLWTLHYI